MTDQVADALGRLREVRAVQRLVNRDASLFRNPDVAADRLGWLGAADAPPAWSERVRSLAESALSDGVEHVVLAGMGGSSLAPEVIGAVLGGHGPHPAATLSVLDTTHPAVVERVLANAGPSTLAIVSSKSGTTEETRAFGLALAEVLPPERLVAITDPGSDLEAQARDAGWRDVVTNPADIGGRYSALSFVGAVPGALAGADVDALWASARRMLAACSLDGEDNPGAVLAAFMAGHALAGRDKLTVILPPALLTLGDWIEQLVAESTGKSGKGVVPIVGEPSADPAAYGDDRAVVAVALGGDLPYGVGEVEAAGHPVLHLHVDTRTQLGAEFVRWEVATALAGVLLDVDPFDEPDVTVSKSATRAVLDALAAGDPLPDPDNGDLAGLLGGVQPRDYVAIQAFLPPDEAHLAPLRRLREAVRDRLRVATTLGIGPRFLHSTGQLHKGGPDSVAAIQVVDTPTGGPAIPGRPYDFASLVRAQAVGDLRSLQERGRRVVRVGVDGAADLAAVVEAVVGAPVW